MSLSRNSLGRRYAEWIDTWRWFVLGLAFAVAATGLWLITALPLRADIANLLPPSQKSVQDLKALKKRARAFGTVFVVVEADDPSKREQAANTLRNRFADIDASLLTNVTYDDRVARQYFWQNRFLFIELDELRDAHAALEDKILQAKLDANPLFISLEDEDEDGDKDSDGDQPDAEEVDARIDELRARLDEAEKKANAPAPFVSRDGRYQFLILQATFSTSNVSRGQALLAQIDAVLSDVETAVGGGIRFGVAGTVATSVYEHESVIESMMLAALITIVLCALALFFYYRTLLPVMASLWSLTVGVLATFAFTKLAIGHLNLMSAFLTAIVVGNGINAGLILLARYFEEVRAGRIDNDGLARAIAGAARGTFAASLTAGVAYGSLIVTDFRGFRHFGVIAGVGMVLCWISAFTVLPACLAVLRRSGRIKPTPPPAVGRILARLMPRRVGIVIVACVLVTAFASVVTWDYLVSDPFLKDWRDLQSKSSDIRVAQQWKKVMKTSFDKKYTRGLTSRFAIGLDRREHVRPLVDKLRAIENERPKGQEVLVSLRSIDDYLPQEQDEKLRLLGEIRSMIDDDLNDVIEGDGKQAVDRIRPPDGLGAMVLEDIPEALAWPFIEKDGSIGRLILAIGSSRFNAWRVDDRVEFADTVRALDLPEDAILGGQSFVIADIIKSMERDGPLAIVVALVGSMLVVFLVVGFRRHGGVTLLCGASGIVCMIALCAAFGVKVHFLDLIALPITIGIGIDYAVNLAVRDRESHEGPERLLSTTGGAVLLCSFTTIVGYGSLLLSNNGGIRSFGLAAILGEISCVVLALALAPAMLAYMNRDSSDV